MKRTMILGLIFTGFVAVANGCSSSTPPPRDYHEYAGIRAGQVGSGDSLGRGIYAKGAMDGEMNGDVQVANGPAAGRQAPPRRVSPSYMPPRQNVAGVPQD